MACLFQYQVDVFFKKIISDGPLGKTRYYVIRFEFYVFGSPRILFFLWKVNAPILTQENIDIQTN